MAKMVARKNHILFKFVDKLKNGLFEAQTDWGLTLTTFYDDTAKLPRWGIVTSVGPDVTHEVQVGTKILIAPLRWTEGFVFEGARYWKTDEDQVLGYE